MADTEPAYAPTLLSSVVRAARSGTVDVVSTSPVPSSDTRTAAATIDSQ